jgi:SNF family Na+-dependent transporter
MIETKVVMSKTSENSCKDKNVRILVENDNKFSSTCSTYLTLLGYSIGIADFWRFPFLLYRNGGGKYIYIFFLTLFPFSLQLNL